MSCDIGEVTKRLENELWHTWSDETVGERAVTYVKGWNGWRMSRAHRYRDIQQSSFSNLSVTSPTSQLILQPFRRFSYVTAHSTTLPLLHLRHSSFSNPSFASPTSRTLHLFHLATRPCRKVVHLWPFLNIIFKIIVLTIETICNNYILTN